MAAHGACRACAWAGAVALALAATAGVSGGAAHAVDLAHSVPQMFGSTTMESADLTQFNKWTSVLAAYESEHQRMYRACQPDESCKLQQWRVFIDSLRGSDPMTQIIETHTRMNSAPYIEDVNNYGQTDYWATPGQFFDRSGDCEDYAIAKFLTLRELGFANDQMRIVVLQDTNLNLVHAVLIVHYGGVAYLLDNQIDQVVRADSVRHYRPYYSLNETRWWRHS